MEIVPEVNRYWEQAAIEWNLVEVIPLEWPDDPDGTRNSLLEARRDIQKLTRDHDTGMMTNKDLRRKIFLEKLIPTVVNDRSTYDVYMFDFIGEESQGM